MSLATLLPSLTLKRFHLRWVHRWGGGACMCVQLSPAFKPRAEKLLARQRQPCFSMVFVNSQPRVLPDTLKATALARRVWVLLRSEMIASPTAPSVPSWAAAASGGSTFSVPSDFPIGLRNLACWLLKLFSTRMLAPSPPVTLHLFCVFV